MRTFCFHLIAVCMIVGVSPPAWSASDEELAARLLAAYPQAGFSLERTGEGLFLAGGGERLLFSPPQGCPEVGPEDQADPPLCAMFAQVYPAGESGRRPPRGFDPGRVRSDALFKRLYGTDGGSVANQCRTVLFLGRPLLFSVSHGAADALERVGLKLEIALRNQPEIAAYIFPIIGSFYWRKIQDSPRLSMHSFGIAVDFTLDKGLYWRWNPPPRQVEAVRREYPQAIVEAFEAEGFIWGGKWDAFDFMHFEYRPELLPR